MSAILSLDDLNDFISPGVACIKPVEVKNEVPRNSGSNVEIEIGIDGNPLEVSIDDGTTRPLEQLQISLSDCLACSGCITSAEEVLVAQHSHKELINALKLGRGDKKFVASISHQSRASIAGAYGLSIDQLDKFLINLFINKLGFEYIVGTGLGRRISLQNSSLQLILMKQEGSAQFPVLSSACPGFILYAEKTHPELLPKISNVKSPQLITGLILKKISSSELGFKEKDIYHLSIMPCFDKKLELARPEKELVTGNALEEDYKDVDCVITLKELIQLLLDENMDIEGMMSEIKGDKSNVKDAYVRYAPQDWPNPIDSWLNDEGSASGGFAIQYLLAYQEFLAASGTRSQIVKIEGRNSDIVEYRLNNENGEKMASTAVVNGFRNIQNIVRKLKNGNVKRTKNLINRRKLRETSSSNEEMADLSRCDYVEIMACPDGCINGGGQISSLDTKVKEWVSNIQGLYYSIPNAAKENYGQWLQEFGDRYGMQLERVVKTRYTDISLIDTGIPTALAIGSKW